MEVVHYYVIWGGTTKNWNLFIKNCVLILTCLNFSHLQSTLHWMRYTSRDVFFHCSKLFLNSLILMPFSASAVFLFCLFLIGKMFPFENFFHPGKQKKVTWGDLRWMRGFRGYAVFGQKLLNTQHGVGRYTCKSPILKWANVLKES